MTRHALWVVVALVCGCAQTGASYWKPPGSPGASSAEQPLVTALPEYYRMQAAKSRVDRTRRVREMATLKTDIEQLDAELREAEKALRDAEVALMEARQKASSASSAPRWTPSSSVTSGGCGSRGGPGYRKANGRCASW